MRKNEVKQKLRDRKCVYGTSLEDSLDPEMAVLLSAAGLDFFFIDTETVRLTTPKFRDYVAPPPVHRSLPW